MVGGVVDVLEMGAAIGAILAIVVAGAVPVWQGRRARGWPTAPGRVIVSETYRTTEFSFDGDPPWHVRVVYEYEVAGRAYRGERIRFGAHTYGMRRNAEWAAGRDPLGQPVRVRYQPGRPERSTLEPGRAVRNWVTALAGAALVAVSIAWALVG